jgi:signal transduction histidine kinase
MAKASRKLEALQKQVQLLKRQALAAERMRFESLRPRKRTGFDGQLFAAGVAHEFNNILGAVDGHAEWALDSGKAADMRDALEVIRQACVRSSQITKALQGIAQPREESKELFSFAAVARELERMAAPVCRKAGLRLLLDVEDAQIYGSSERILEVLFNLVRNAADALVGRELTEADRVLSLTAKVLRRQLRVRLRDRGPGIPDMLADLVFQPFFTTKGTLAQTLEGAGKATGVQGGSGLGLYLSRGLVEDHGGTLTLTPRSKLKGPGAEFEMLLPVAPAAKRRLSETAR